MLQALKARDKPCHLDHDHFNAILSAREIFRAFSTITVGHIPPLRAVPLAIAFRAVGAETHWANGSIGMPNLVANLCVSPWIVTRRRLKVPVSGRSRLRRLQIMKNARDKLAARFQPL
jgi:hypothetical protein